VKLGFLFAFVYQKAGSIWPGIILHAIVNGLAMAVALSQT
jgi:membrane protease YdiL (CAAX protease family)